MRVIGLVESLDHVCARYRLFPYVEPLAEAGISLEIAALPTGVPARQAFLWGLRGCRVILLRKLLGWLDWKILRSRAMWIGFDLDDAVFLRDSYSGKDFTDARRSARFSRIVREADAITGGNRHLCLKAEEYGARGVVRIIPTCVDTRKYTPRKGISEGRPLTLVWIGSSSTLKGLDRFRATLEELGRAIPGLRLKLICDKFINLKDLETIHCAWSEETEARELATADVGISWIPDDPWSRGKCGLKLIQCMAAGLPVIANPVGVHPEMVHQGENGFLAESPAEWVDSVNRLVSGGAARESMGGRGRKLVEERYSIAVGARAWREILQ